MEVLKCKNIQKEFSSRLLFSIPDLAVHSGERIGIVGRNGTGKTTFLRMIIGEDIDFEGEIVIKGSVAYVPQIKEMTNESGGEVTLRLLKEALSTPSSILILDEPTSHLDTYNTNWLINKLLRFSGAVIIVSHDRFLMDRIVDKILLIEDNSIKSYIGGFSEFEIQRQAEKERKLKEIELYQSEVKRLTKELENKKNKSRNLTKKKKKVSRSDWKVRSKMGSYDSQSKAMAKSAKAIEKRLSRLEKPETVQRSTFIKFKNIGALSDLSARTLLSIQSSELSTPYIHLKIPQFTIKFGDKVILKGRNKSGKSTFLQSIVNGMLSAYYSEHLKIGYFSQKLDLLDKKKSLFDNISSGSCQSKQTIINVLAMLDLKMDKIFIPCEKLSGGEQVKGQLAKVLLSDSNFLILDEPTNFLDMESVIALEKYLLQFPGSILMVSHDIYFQSKTNFKVLCIANSEITLEEKML